MAAKSKQDHSQPPAPDNQVNISLWWMSADKMRGFCWDSVVGYDYKKGGSNSNFPNSVLYVYLQSAILHLHGAEADSVYAGLVAKQSNK